MAAKQESLQIWPVKLDRSGLPEALGLDGARRLENIEERGGRLVARKGLSNVVGVGPHDKRVTSAHCVRRGDNAMLVFWADEAGAVRLTLGAAVAGTDLSEYGALTTTQGRENFDEEGGE